MSREEELKKIRTSLQKLEPVLTELKEAQIFNANQIEIGMKVLRKKLEKL